MIVSIYHLIIYALSLSYLVCIFQSRVKLTSKPHILSHILHCNAFIFPAFIFSWSNIEVFPDAYKVGAYSPRQETFPTSMRTNHPSDYEDFRVGSFLLRNSSKLYMITLHTISERKHSIDYWISVNLAPDSSLARYKFPIKEIEFYIYHHLKTKMVYLYCFQMRCRYRLSNSNTQVYSLSIVFMNNALL